MRIVAGFTVAAIIAIGGLIVLPAFKRRNFLEELLDAHLRSMIGTHLTDVSSGNPRTVKAWFHGKVDFTPKVMDLAPDGFPLVGGRLDLLQDRAVAALVYRSGQKVVNVFVTPKGVLASGESTVRRFNIVGWSDQDLRYWAISNARMTDLSSLRSAFVAYAHSE